MNRLVVLAHPDLANSRINAAWKSALLESESVYVHDLYQKYKSSPIDVLSEQKLVERFEKIVFQFPMQWYSCPSLLKLWIDEVFESGWAYGDGGEALKGKTLGIAVSTFSKEKDYRADGRYQRTIEDLTSPFEVTAARVGMNYKPGFFLHDIGEVNEQMLVESSHRYIEFINQL